MSQITHPILGPIDLAASRSWYVEVNFGGRTVIVDLTIETAGLPESALQGLPQELADLEPLDRAARAAIVADAKAVDEDSAAALYLTHHYDELETKIYQRLFGGAAPDLDNPEPYLSRLRLVRVGLYPESDTRRIVLDYSIDPDMTHYLLCVGFDSANKVVSVELES